jgi:hypothetical protein
VGHADPEELQKLIAQALETKPEGE